MPNVLLIIPISLGMMIAGIVILVLQNQEGVSRRRSNLGDLEAVPQIIAWTLIVIGLFALAGILSGPLFPLVWVVLAIILLSLLYRFRSVERRSLLWTLMLAAERNIPLDTAARAFASERHDHIGQRAFDLAEYLEAGLPLALALHRSRLHYPQSILLSAELGQQTNNLGGALRRAMGSNNESEIVMRSVAERIFYLICVILFGMSLVTFVTMKIVPAIQRIFEEFGLDLPGVMRVFIAVAYALLNYWFIFLPVGIVLIVLMLRSLSYYTGTSPRYMPGIVAGWQRTDRSVIMHWLAHAVRQNRPLPEMMRLVSAYLTKRRLRAKLQRTARRIDQGLDWTECLQEAGLIRRPEAAVFRAAERTGNLAWALDEMAESNARRSIYRLRALTNVAFPVAILVLGSFVLLITSAVMSTLFKLISSLT